MMRTVWIGWIVLLTLAAAGRAAEDAYRLLPLESGDPPPREMMKRYLIRQVEAAHLRWQDDYEQRKTPEAITEYQQRLKSKFIEAIGGFPERTPLEPQVAGTHQGDGYRVEKVLFQSQPQHYVTAALFLPDSVRYQPPYPGILVVCGHSANGKALPVYQQACALAALNGMAALIVDPIDQGERHQLLDDKGKPRLSGTAGHNMVGVGSILVGRNTALFEIWDGMRAIDYLQSRPDIDGQRIGCMGNSGGGTQTSYLMALDERIVAAAPSCYLCSLYGRQVRTGAQDAEQNIFGQLAWGMDHADYCMMRAPRPTLMCTATRDFFDIEDAWTSYRYAKRLYTRMGFGERMSLVEADENHGWTVRLREAGVRWMLRWLADRDEAIFEPDGLQVLTDQEIQVTPHGQVMLIDDARSVYDLNRDRAAELDQRRKADWSGGPPAGWRDEVRRLAGIRPLAELPEPAVRRLAVLPGDGCQVHPLILSPEDGIQLPALWFVPTEGASKAAVLYLHEDGKTADTGPDGPIAELLRAGKSVLAIDLRGTGETQQVGQKYFNPERHGPDGQDWYIAYLLGRSYVGMRAEDVLVAARWLAAQTATGGKIELNAVGHATIPATHAAALEPQLFSVVRLVRPLVSWTNTVELGYAATPLAGLVHGALAAYDLPELRSVLESAGKLHLDQPLDAAGRPVEP
jgi:cephalosporin-C deacetylase-like acetyl esterase